jgi:hypothetical protein
MDQNHAREFTSDKAAEAWGKADRGLNAMRPRRRFAQSRLD